jgi:hypothetical protein
MVEGLIIAEERRTPAAVDTSRTVLTLECAGVASARSSIACWTKYAADMTIQPPASRFIYGLARLIGVLACAAAAQAS